MRKRYKNKKKCCACCKPHKRGWENRWSIKDLSAEEQAEHEIQGEHNVDLPDFLCYETADYIEMMNDYDAQKKDAA